MLALIIDKRVYDCSTSVLAWRTAKQCPARAPPPYPHQGLVVWHIIEDAAIFNLHRPRQAQMPPIGPEGSITTMNKNLSIQYHQQDTNYYCGAACAQMILEQCGVGLLDQASLYNDNHNHSTTESGWATGPDGLTWTLNNRQSGRYFVLDQLQTEDAISRMIVWTIHHYGIGPAALVYGSQHWIVVRGCTTSAAPTSSADINYTISSFDVNNPWPPTPPPPPPPPHTTGDPCGTGGNRGTANEHVSYTQWRSTYMTGVPGGHWAGRFIAVCDPDPPAARLPHNQEPRPFEFDGEHILEAATAVELSDHALRRTGLVEREDWSPFLDRAAAGEPVLVQRLDLADSFYWIVPRLRDGVTTSAVSIDARFGDYQETLAVPGERRAGLFALDRDDVERVLTERRFELPRNQGQLVVRPGLVTVTDHWVWRPCTESLSPFWPFRLATYGDHRLFVRSDGAVFTHLTTTELGI